MPQSPVERPSVSLTQTPSALFSEGLVERWLAFLDVSQKSVQTYTRAIRQFLLFLRSHDVSRPTRDDVVHFRESLLADHKATTVQAYLVAVKIFFTWCEQEGLYPNVAKRVKSPKISSEHKKDPLTANQAKLLLGSIDVETARGKRDHAIFALMLTTGLRTISIINADVGDVRTLGDASVLFYQGKGRSEKNAYVKLALPVEVSIRRYLATREGTEETDPLFASLSNRDQGGRLTTRSISRIVKTHLRGIELNSPRLTAHSLRHTAATQNLLSGGTLEETQQLLDHRNLNTTMIYAHALERMKNTSEYRISRQIFGE